MNELRKCGIYISTMKLYSVIKKNGIVLFASKWMGLENFMLSKVTHTQKIRG
jgi:hypothetical protein